MYLKLLTLLSILVLFSRILITEFTRCSEKMAFRNKNLPPLSSSSIKELEDQAPMKQGILTILNSNCASTSLRRTLSADMSSKKWLAQNGFSSLKKIDSSKENEDEKIPAQDDIWNSIQLKKEAKKPAQKKQVWGSILTQKSENSQIYIHPLVKKSSSTMSEKSLEICTEGLGSETGSDGFSSYPNSEVDEEELKLRVVDFHVPAKRIKSPVRTLPPPLSSISGGDGAAVRVNSRRRDGRLVLEAVSIPARKCFNANRRDGRLILTLVNGQRGSQDLEGSNGFEEVFDPMDEIDRDFTEDLENVFESKSIENLVEQNSRSLPSGGVIGVAKSGLIMKKIMTFGKKNSAWSDKFDKVVDSIPRSLPLPPPVVASSFNNDGFITGNGNKSEHFVSYLKGCKEPRRTLLFWKETHCIAT